jgi:hypothetical protein
MNQKNFTTSDVQRLTGVNVKTALAWALKNNIAHVGSGKRKIYIWTPEDVQRLLHRPRPGGRRPKPEAPDE